jgi:hypothetical protein
MGIDIYARWEGQTEEEKQAQYTGFSTCHGHVGYLREAYHGGPYATSELVPEAFDHEKCAGEGDFFGAEIKGSDLAARLPKAALAALIREATIYSSGDARAILCEMGIEPKAPGSDIQKVFEDGEVEEVAESLAKVFMREIPMLREGAAGLDAEVATQIPELKITDSLMAKVVTVDTVRSLFLFVRLCILKERETGRPCRIYASY